MVSYYRKRNDSKIYHNRQYKSLKFLYKTFVGKMMLRKLVNPSFSIKIGKFLDKPKSKFLIKKFLKRNYIDMDLYEKKEYTSYNDFFTRKIRPEERKIGNNFISPCDSKLLVYKISDDRAFNIKGHKYSTYDLVKNDIVSKYNNGYCLIFRLDCTDYHRYCYIDDGYKDDNIYIPGVFHTVQDLSSKKYNIYKENCREYTVLHTKNYDDVIEVEVGALMVGRITNYDGKSEITKGIEKGKFEYGGSTIVLLVKENVIEVDKDILENSENNIETVVKYGENIGKKITK